MSDLTAVSNILWILIVAGIVMIAGLLVIRAIDILRAKPSTTPRQSEILEALRPLMLQGIIAALFLAKKAITDIDVALSNLNMADIANAAYDLIPNTVVIGGHTWPVEFVKSIVTRQLFAEFVKTNYDAIHAWILQNENYLISQVDALKTIDTVPVKSGDTPALGTSLDTTGGRVLPVAKSAV